MHRGHVRVSPHSRHHLSERRNVASAASAPNSEPASSAVPCDHTIRPPTYRRGTYVVQGWRVAGRHDSVEIPHRLLKYLEQGTYIGARLVDTGRGSFTLSGAPVTDPEASSQMNLPGHETCVEVPKEQEVWFGGVAAG